MKIYANLEKYNQKNRYYLTHILKAIVNDLSFEEKVKKYGDWVGGFTNTLCIEDADICLMTMQWNYYVDRGIVDLAESEIDFALAHNKKIVAFKDGDESANLSNSNVILFEIGGNRSLEGLCYHSGIPFFIKDYLQLYCEGTLKTRKKKPIPTVGFCGQVTNSLSQKVYLQIRHQLRKNFYQFGFRKWQPPPFETTSFRFKVLSQFSKNAKINTNYVLRSKISSHKQQDYATQRVEYINNLLTSDYIVSVRGWGNFSVRFYETLCLGRIPVFIDTDCLLPFDDKIDYKSLFPWITKENLPHAAEILLDYHNRLSVDDFIDIQKQCRNLWENHFTPDGFYKDFVEKMSEII